MESTGRRAVETRSISSGKFGAPKIRQRPGPWDRHGSPRAVCCAKRHQLALPIHVPPRQSQHARGTDEPHSRVHLFFRKNGSTFEPDIQCLAKAQLHPHPVFPARWALVCLCCLTRIQGLLTQGNVPSVLTAALNRSAVPSVFHGCHHWSRRT